MAAATLARIRQTRTNQAVARDATLTLDLMDSEERRRYLWSMIKFVPHTPSGEFVNIGVLVGSDETEDWVCARVSDTRRAEQFGGKDLLDAVWGKVADFEQHVARLISGEKIEFWAEGDKISTWEDWLRLLHRDHRNLVQTDYPAPALELSAAAGAESLLEWCVGKPPSDF